MELKYENKPMWKAIGSCWLITAGLHITLVFMTISFSGFDHRLIWIYALNFFLNALLAIHFFTLPKKVYIKIGKSIVTINRSGVIPIPDKKIPIDQIVESQVKGKFILLLLTNGKKEKIRSEMLSGKDRNRLLDQLDDLNLTVK